MNCIIYKNNSNTIEYFIENCVKENDNYIGLNCKLHGVKSKVWSIKWTDDIVNSIYDNDGNQIGWDKTVDQITESQEKTEINKTSDLEYRTALRFRDGLAKLDYNQIDNYIDNEVVSFEEAKDYLKKLSKVVLGIIKIMDRG
jgi:hypothetical protein